MAFGTGFSRPTGGAVTYYNEIELTNAYVEYSFGGNVNTITVTNDSATDVAQVSYDGATLEGDLKNGETMTFNVNSKSSVYLKATTGGDNVRVWGW